MAAMYEEHVCINKTQPIPPDIVSLLEGRFGDSMLLIQNCQSVAFQIKV